MRIAAHYANISILAPTRGATYTRKNVSLSTRLFQSSLPRGERPQTALAGIPTTYFNPRSHEGSDSGSLGSNAGAMDFNPRSHEGSDVATVAFALQIRISILAPTRGATSICILQRSMLQISILAPTRGATICE